MQQETLVLLNSQILFGLAKILKRRKNFCHRWISQNKTFYRNDTTKRLAGIKEKMKVGQIAFYARIK